MRGVAGERGGRGGLYGRLRGPPVHSRAMRVLVAFLVLLAAACQPIGGPSVTAPTPGDDGATGRPLGAPDAGVASTLDDLVTRGHAIAEEWQADPVLSEVQVDLDAAGGWSQARLVYVAGDADRMLQLETAGAGFTQQRPSLGTLNIQPVPGEALTEVPAFPDDAMAPQKLATAPAAGECGISGQATVLYTSGAPYAWDGTTWTDPPAWTATVTAAGGSAVRLDPVSGAGDGCL